MAQIGLKYVVTGKYKESAGKATYASGVVIGKAIKADIKINCNDAKLYADDAVAESDRSFIDGTITLGVADLEAEKQAFLFGHEVDEETGEIVANTADVAANVGVGFYSAKKVNGVRKYRAIFFKNVLFTEPSETLQTKEGTVSFATPSLEGNIMEDIEGIWKEESTFDTEAEAKSYLDKKVGITNLPA